MSVLNEVAAKLAALGLGAVDVDIHMARMPATPDVACAVYEYGGAPPDMGFGVSGVKFESPAVQVVFRGAPNDYSGPRSRALTAFSGLAAVEATTLSGTFYHTVHPQQSPFPIRQDEDDRWLIACNYLCEKDPS